MAYLTGQQLADFQAWKQSRRQQQPSFLQSGIIGDLTKPFRTLGQQITDTAGFFIDPNKPIQNNTATFLTPEEQASYWENPAQGGAQAGAGIAAFAVPAGQGVSGLAKSGLASGTLAGYGQTGTLEGALTGGVTGGATGAGLGLLGRGLSKLTAGGAQTGTQKTTGLSTKLRDYADERDLVTLRRNVGTNAPQTGTKGTLKGALLEKRTLDLSNQYTVPIKSGEDLFTLSDSIMADKGGVIREMAETLGASGKKVDVSPVISGLRDKLKSTKSARLSAPIRTTIDELQGMIGRKKLLNPVEALKVKDELGRLMSSTSADEKTLTELFRSAYFRLDDQIDAAFKANRVKNFKDINKDVYAAIRINDWGQQATSRVRPVSTITHSFQQAGMLGGIMAGGPGAALGLAGSKFAQSPTMESLLSKGARRVADSIEGVNTPQLSGLGQKLGNTVNGVANRMAQSPFFEGFSPQNAISSAAASGVASGTNPNINNQQMTGMQGTTPNNFDMTGGGMSAGGGLSGNTDLLSQAILSDVLSGKMTEGQAGLAIKLLGLDQKAQQPKLTEADKKFALAGDLAQNALSLLESGQAQTGKVQDIKGGLERFFGTETGSQTEYRSQIALARTAVRNAMLGANMSPGEMESIAAFIPEYTDEPEIAANKLRSFIQTMQLYSNNNAGTQPAVELSGLQAVL